MYIVNSPFTSTRCAAKPHVIWPAHAPSGQVHPNSCYYWYLVYLLINTIWCTVNQLLPVLGVQPNSCYLHLLYSLSYLYMKQLLPGVEPNNYHLVYSLTPSTLGTIQPTLPGEPPYLVYSVTPAGVMSTRCLEM
jgi:hypothetical protein